MVCWMVDKHTDILQLPPMSMLDMSVIELMAADAVLVAEPMVILAISMMNCHCRSCSRLEIEVEVEVEGSRLSKNRSDSGKRHHM